MEAAMLGNHNKCIHQGSLVSLQRLGHASQCLKVELYCKYCTGDSIVILRYCICTLVSNLGFG